MIFKITDALTNAKCLMEKMTKSDSFSINHYAIP